MEPFRGTFPLLKVLVFRICVDTEKKILILFDQKFNAEPGKFGRLACTGQEKEAYPSTLVQMRCFLE